MPVIVDSSPEQAVVDGKYVTCVVCKSRNLLNLHTSAWFDRYAQTEGDKGGLVHYSCLSEKRLNEIQTLRESKTHHD